MDKLTNKNNNGELIEKLLLKNYSRELIDRFLEVYTGPRYDYVEDYMWLLDGFIGYGKLDADKPEGL